MAILEIFKKIFFNFKFFMFILLSTHISISVLVHVEGGSEGAPFSVNPFIAYFLNF